MDNLIKEYVGMHISDYFPYGDVVYNDDLVNDLTEAYNEVYYNNKVLGNNEILFERNNIILTDIYF
jgi:hypothetical protein